MNSLDRRVAKLEGTSGRGDIAIWVDDPKDVPAAVNEMIRTARITEADRSRCVFWERAKAKPSEHENALASLTTSTSQD